jgi:hypothetical protein
MASSSTRQITQVIPPKYQVRRIVYPTIEVNTMNPSIWENLGHNIFVAIAERKEKIIFFNSKRTRTPIQFNLLDKSDSIITCFALNNLEALVVTNENYYGINLETGDSFLAITDPTHRNAMKLRYNSSVLLSPDKSLYLFLGRKNINIFDFKNQSLQIIHSPSPSEEMLTTDKELYCFIDDFIARFSSLDGGIEIINSKTLATINIHKANYKNENYKNIREKGKDYIIKKLMASSNRQFFAIQTSVFTVSRMARRIRDSSGSLHLGFTGGSERFDEIKLLNVNAKGNLDLLISQKCEEEGQLELQALNNEAMIFQKKGKLIVYNIKTKKHDDSSLNEMKKIAADDRKTIATKKTTKDSWSFFCNQNLHEFQIQCRMTDRNTRNFPEIPDIIAWLLTPTKDYKRKDYSKMLCEEAEEQEILTEMKSVSYLSVFPPSLLPLIVCYVGDLLNTPVIFTSSHRIS